MLVARASHEQFALSTRDVVSMLLKYIEMENVRSYIKQKVEFPGGTTLLAGDVGAGKSSVLLAIEFALFGIQRGEVSGSDILRHGKDYGYTELGFELDGKKVVIKRSFKRNNRGVEQDEGWIDVDGTKLHKTPQEMRAFVLQHLGYSQEYITKNPILYRYTVYTPQDQMKSIVFEKPDDRIVILRKLFGIDKYGTIRNNASTSLVELRALKREKEAYARDLEEKLKERDRRKNEMEEARKNMGEAQAKLTEVEKLAKEREMQLQAAEEEARALLHVEKTMGILEDQIGQNTGRMNACMKEAHQLAQKEAMLKQEFLLPSRQTETTEEELAERREELKRQGNALLSQKSVLDNEINRARGILEKGLCNFCGQVVSDAAHFEHEIEERMMKAEKLKAAYDSAEKEMQETEKLIAEARDYKYALQSYQRSQQALNDVWSRKQIIEKDIHELEVILANARIQLDSLRSESQRLPEVKERESKARSAFASAQRMHLDAAQSHSRLEAFAKAIEREIETYEKDIAARERSRKEAQKIAGIISWLEAFFLPLMEKIEQSVMHTIQQEFCSYFQEWFSILMESENMQVSVDREFTPLIDQQGYSTEYQNLSGGEKTSVALAYRLALNKVINSFVESIKTKDLIILDEPTDGFSAEQIDRIRDVLQKLALRQMIIVSHEPKIDTFVDHVIRFYKEGHVSRAVAG